MTDTVTCLAFPAGRPPFPEALGVAERIEAGVFRTRFGETAENLRAYYTDHLPQTRIVLVHDGGWAGMMRLGLPGPLASLSLEDSVAPPFEADVLADLAGDEPVVLLDILTTAVRRRFRNRRIFEHMLGAAARVAGEQGCTHVVAMVDRRVYVYLRRRRLACTLHSGWHPYYGSPATGVVSVGTAQLRRWLDRPEQAGG
ncbi:hypothetical protein [Pseudonocardia abyssalis]|uniref:N-acetyltransferase domain-containing protein n=1 Tax=Pseudonocardia abyssalis TaxID=2792008 RepID=A0ABS6UNC0_9PSEU|nr:hypothetical protein [Pseudonocardia abyssalis]MBW0118800.1 hypothetical protein [Pseudonocardia abyssalis]MBW0133682.1 hypothetical protein [Pseudonocardia abyssalis]